MTEQNAKSRPTHTIYKVVGEGRPAKWIKVGVAFQHQDGQGQSLLFDAIPTEGRIVIRVNREDNRPRIDRAEGQMKQVALALTLPRSVKLPAPRPQRG